MLKQAISNHPVLDNVSREVDILEIKFDENKKEINMELKVTHYSGYNPIIPFNKKIRLIADNKVQIEGKGDYDYLIEAIESNVGIKDLINGIINQRDLDGTINSKMGYGPEITE